MWKSLWKVLGYIYQTARREFRLVGALKIMGLALVPTIWAGIASLLKLEDKTPSTFTWFLLTALFLCFGFLFIIAKRALSLEEPQFELSLHFPPPVEDRYPELKWKFVNVSVKNKSGINLENCTAFLIGLLKDEKPTDFDKPIPLIWNMPSGNEKTTIVVGMEVVCHVAEASSLGHGLRIVGKQYIRLKDIFEDAAVYRFEVLINAGERSKIIIFDVNWKKNWETLSATKIGVKNVTGEIS